MSSISGFLRELKHRPNSPIEYSIATNQLSLELNELIGQHVSIQFTGKRACIACGRSVKKLYQNGYCFPCVTSLAECDLCIVKPHECHFAEGTCRDTQFAETHCMIPHYVYLAFSSGVKVGLTRKGRQLTRWIDQGASEAMVIAEVPTRKIAGELEMEIAKNLPDKTDWRKMLRYTGGESVDLLEIKKEIAKTLSPEHQPYLLTMEEIFQFVYPREDDFDVKLVSHSLDKSPLVAGVLRGIKGQYLLFDEGVFNVKKHAGFHVEVSA